MKVVDVNDNERVAELDPHKVISEMRWASRAEDGAEWVLPTALGETLFLSDAEFGRVIEAMQLDGKVDVATAQEFGWNDEHDQNKVYVKWPDDTITEYVGVIM